MIDDEQSGASVKGEGIQIGDSGVQSNLRAETINVFHGGGGRKPREPRPGGRRQGRQRRVAVAAVVIAASCLIAVYFLIGQQPSVVTTRVVGNSPLFEDQRVLNYLDSQGYAPDGASREFDSLGSWDICDYEVRSLVAAYDLANLGDRVEADCVSRNLAHAGMRLYEDPFNVAPLVIVARSRVVRQLEQEGVVREENRIYIFNVARYLHLMIPAAGIPVGKDCRSLPGGLGAPLGAASPAVTTTDPRRSSSGSVFAAIEYHALLGNNNVRITEPFQACILTAIRPNLSIEDSHTSDLMQDFISSNGVIEMAAVYENDYLYDEINGIGPAGVVMMYPNPDIIADDTLVAWNSAGYKQVEALKSTGMKKLMEQDGFRPSGDGPGFVSAMTGKGHTVPDIDRPPAGLQFYPDNNSQRVLQDLAREITAPS